MDCSALRKRTSPQNTKHTICPTVRHDSAIFFSRQMMKKMEGFFFLGGFLVGVNERHKPILEASSF
jgi:hypothetical protein